MDTETNTLRANDFGDPIAQDLEVAARKQNTCFEIQSWINAAMLPAMWLLTYWVAMKKVLRNRLEMASPNTNTFWFDGLGSSCRKVKEGAASWKALDIIYNRPFGVEKNIGGYVDDFWNNTNNAKALRNRLRLIKEELRSAILSFSECEEVRILSLAAGSAQAVIEVMAEMPECKISSLLIDVDPSALDYARSMASELGVADKVETIESSVARVQRISKDFRPQIIEMLGFLDYIPQDKAVRLVGKIMDCLEPAGIFLTCNIAPNSEMNFLKWVINWDMIYRTSDDLKALFDDGADCYLEYEPLGIHGVIRAKKTTTG